MSELIDRKRSIGDVARELEIPTHVIRFWEEHFPQIRPEIGAGNRRYYYEKQIQVLRKIKKFLYDDGYTIAGLQKLLKKRGYNEARQQHDIEIITKNAREIEREIAHNLENVPKPPEPEKEISLEHFIAPGIDIKVGEAIDPETKMLDFSSIKISAIDVTLKMKIEKHLKVAQDKLEELKGLKII